MAAATAVPLRGPTEPKDFITGKPHVLPTGTDLGITTHFSDMEWTIAAGKHGRAPKRVSFHGVPDWLLLPAKAALAEGWLGAGLSPDWVQNGLRTYRFLAKALPDFVGADVTALSPDHVRRLRAYAGALIEKSRAALDVAEARADAEGKRLSSRDVRHIALQSGGLMRLSDMANYFNAAVDAADRYYGLSVPVTLRMPEDLTSAPRGLASADPLKVMSYEATAALLRVLDHEVYRYDRACALVEQSFASADWKAVVGKECIDWGAVTRRYLGLGTRCETSAEIAKSLGWSVTAESNVGRKVKQFLDERVPVDVRTRALALRQKIVMRAKLSAVHQAAIRELFENVDLSWREPNQEAIQRYFGLGDFSAHGFREVGVSTGLTSARGPFMRMWAWVPRLIGDQRARRVFYLRQEMPGLLARAVKATAVKTQIAVARRIGALVEMPLDPKLTFSEVEGTQVVQIELRAHKTYGDEGAPDIVPCPGWYGEVLVEALSTARRLTADLRHYAPGEIAGLLFLVPDRGESALVPIALSEKGIHEFVYTNQPGKDSGILRRYACRLPDETQGFQFHHIRHTNATRMVSGGAAVADAAEYLGHDVPRAVGQQVSSLPLMAHIAYVAGASDDMKRRTIEALTIKAIARGAASGRQWDAMVRVAQEELRRVNDEATEVMGTAGADAGDIMPPAQLTLEAALERIRTGDVVQKVTWTPEHAVQMMKQGVVLQITRYGGCMLPADAGPCPTALRCPLGVSPESEDTKCGGGCCWQVLLPHAEETLARDLEIMCAERERMQGPAWETWRAHQSVQIRIWESQLQRVRSLASESTQDAASPSGDTVAHA